VARARTADTTDSRASTSREKYLRTFLGDAGDSPDTALFLVVLLAGALGGLLHSIRSFVWYVGNRQLRWSWVPRYLVLPIEGALLSAVTYLLVRAGFLGFHGNATPSAYGFAATGALMGMFSQPAILKLKQVAETLFTTPPQGSDAVPQSAAGTAAAPTERLDDLPGTDAPIPVLVSVALEECDSQRVVRITGSGFRPNSVVSLSGVLLTDTTISATEIAARLRPDHAVRQPLEVSVTTPPPGGGTSNTLVVSTSTGGA